MLFRQLPTKITLFSSAILADETNDSVFVGYRAHENKTIIFVGSVFRNSGRRKYWTSSKKNSIYNSIYKQLWKALIHKQLLNIYIHKQNYEIHHHTITKYIQ
jgi:Fe-S cluster biosynthesis and repair protein YggX